MHRDSISSERNAPLLRGAGKKGETEMNNPMHQTNYTTDSAFRSNTVLSVTFFDNKHDARVDQQAFVAWADMVNILKRHVRRKEKDGQLFAPATFRAGGRRCAGDVESLSMLVLDFDDGTPPTEVTTAWEQWEYVIYSTHSHKPDAPKWRAVFPLARPVPAGEWKDTYRKLAAHLAGGRADRSCKDVSRMYYLPSCPPEHAALAFAEHHPGRPLDPNEVPEPTEKGERRRAVLPAVIRKGERNPTLFPWACALRREGLSEEEILARLIKENEERCEEPLSDEDVRGIAHRAAQYPAGEAGQGEGRGGGRRSVATTLVELAEAAGIEFWHTPERARFVSVPVGKHTEHWSLDSTDFREWLQDRLYQEEGRTANRSAVDEALGVLARWARRGDEHPIYTRIGEAEGAIYLDLADSEWRAVRIDAEGWEVVSNPPARFRRPAGQLALPTPERGGTLDELRTFINVPDEAWPLVAAWVLFALRPDADAFGDFPVLVLGGQPGSAKSTTSSVLKRLIDPHKAELRGTIRNDHDLAVAAQHSWVVTLDNLSGIPVWLSDALCRLATGNGYSARALYTNDEEVVFYAKRPQIVNGIGDFATRSDLLDRALLINCPRIPDTARQTKTKFWPRFRAAWPRLLGAVLDALAGALAELPKVELAGAPRMSDFAVFATAAARAGAFDEEAFWRAYDDNRENAHALALEASPVAQAVLALLEDAGGKWEGTATGLLNALAGYVEPETRRLHAWPKKADGLSKALEGLAENLRAVGVTVTRNRTGRARVVMLTRSSDAKVTPSDAKVTPGDANGDAKQAPRSQAGRGFAPNGDANDAKNTLFSVDPREREGEERGEPAGERAAPPEKKDTQNGVIGVTGVTAASPQNTETPDADDHQDPVGDEIDNCACGRPADRYTPDGKPFCNECGAPAPDAHQDPVKGNGTLSDSGESEVVL